MIAISEFIERTKRMYYWLLIGVNEVGGGQSLALALPWPNPLPLYEIVSQCMKASMLSSRTKWELLRHTKTQDFSPSARN